MLFNLGMAGQYYGLRGSFLQKQVQVILNLLIIWSLSYLSSGDEGQFFIKAIVKLLMFMPRFIGGLILSQTSSRTALYCVFAYIILTLNTQNFAFIWGNPDWIANSYFTGSLLILAPDIFHRKIKSVDNWLIAICFLMTAVLFKLVLAPWLLLLIFLGAIMAFKQKNIQRLEFFKIIIFVAVMVLGIAAQYSEVEYIRDFENPTQYYNNPNLFDNAIRVLTDSFYLSLPFLLVVFASIFYLVFFSIGSFFLALLTVMGMILWYTNLAYDVRHLVLFTIPSSVLALSLFYLKLDFFSVDRPTEKQFVLSAKQIILPPVLVALWSVPVLGDRELLVERYEYYQLSDNNRYEANLEALKFIDSDCKIYNAAHHLNVISIVLDRLAEKNGENDRSILLERLYNNEDSDTNFTIFHARSDNFLVNLKQSLKNNLCSIFIFILKIYWVLSKLEYLI